MGDVQRKFFCYFTLGTTFGIPSRIFASSKKVVLMGDPRNLRNMITDNFRKIQCQLSIPVRFTHQSRKKTSSNFTQNEETSLVNLYMTSPTKTFRLQIS